MKKYIIAFMIGAIVFAGCTPQTGEEKLKAMTEKVKPGMTAGDIEKEFGKPTKVEKANKKDAKGKMAEVWIYQGFDAKWDLWVRFTDGKADWADAHDRNSPLRGGAAGG